MNSKIRSFREKSRLLAAGMGVPTPRRLSFSSCSQKAPIFASFGSKFGYENGRPSVQTSPSDRYLERPGIVFLHLRTGIRNRFLATSAPSFDPKINIKKQETPRHPKAPTLPICRTIRPSNPCTS